MAAENWITAQEAADICGVTRACIHNWRKAGVFRTVEAKKTPRGEKKIFRFIRKEVEAVAKSVVSVVRN